MDNVNIAGDNVCACVAVYVIFTHTFKLGYCHHVIHDIFSGNMCSKNKQTGNDNLKKTSYFTIECKIRLFVHKTVNILYI